MSTISKRQARNWMIYCRDVAHDLPEVIKYSPARQSKVWLLIVPLNTIQSLLVDVYNPKRCHRVWGGGFRTFCWRSLRATVQQFTQQSTLHIPQVPVYILPAIQHVNKVFPRVLLRHQLGNDVRTRVWTEAHSLASVHQFTDKSSDKALLLVCTRIAQDHSSKRRRGCSQIAVQWVHRSSAGIVLPMHAVVYWLPKNKEAGKAARQAVGASPRSRYEYVWTSHFIHRSEKTWPWECYPPPLLAPSVVLTCWTGTACWYGSSPCLRFWRVLYSSPSRTCCVAPRQNGLWGLLDHGGAVPWTSGSTRPYLTCRL